MIATTTLPKASPPPLPTTTAAAGEWTLAIDPLPAALATVSRGRAARSFTTPQQLWGALGCISLGALAMWAACAGALVDARAGLKSVGEDAAPSIIAAGHLRAELADLDCNLVNALISPPGSADARTAAAIVTQRRHEIAENFVRAAQHITLGEPESIPLTTLAENVPAYEATLTRAKAALESGNRPAALNAVRDAADGLRLFLQPAAVLLDYNKSTALDKAYAEARRGAMTGLMDVLGIGGALTLGLVAFQVWLSRRTRRVLNPGLLGATLLSAALTLWTAASLLRAGGQLRAGTEDSLASIRYVWQTRALAYGINGEESRWLFDREDPARAAASERAFLDGAARIAWREPSTPGRGTDELSTALAAAANRLGMRLPAEPGYLQRELENTTYPGESEEAGQALVSFRGYFKLDRRIRELETRGDHAGAVALCLSYAPEGSNGTFERFDAALGRLLDIEGREFNLAMTRGQAALGGLDALAPVAALGIAGLAFAGIWPRLREYAL